MRSDYCVYVHCRKTDNKVFYVGKGSVKRANIKSPSARNEYWGRVAKKHGFYCVIVYRNLTNEKANEIEVNLISEFGKENLCNLTNGGDGSPGRVVTDDMKLLMSKKFKGQSPSENTIKASMAACQKKVGTVCGLRFESATKASIFFKSELGIKTACKSTILRSANGRMKNAYGYEFRFIDNNGELMPSKYTCKADLLKKAVKNNNGDKFESTIEAARWILDSNLSSASNIRTVVTNIKSSIMKRGKSLNAYGFDWSYV